MKQKEPLYRRVNTRTRGVRHGGGEYRWTRHLRAEKARPQSMHGKERQGLDYTPLFRFLLSRVGSDWTTTHSEAVSRLDTPDPIFWLVAIHEADRKNIVRVGESSYYSGLYVDADNTLRVVDADIRIEELQPHCTCCTHTFNGKPFVRKDVLADRSSSRLMGDA